MRPKVSMVASCYNKRNYIEAFFKSVLDQDWDNIELILINNGSNDGTEDYVRNAVPDFQARGYDVVFLDFEENRGLPGAVKEGLLRVTGEYVCVVDCDDELYPDYASTMAKYLESHPEHEWCICDFDVRYVEQGKLFGREEHWFGMKDLDNVTLEDFMYNRFARMVWRYMIRASYLSKCAIVENMQVWNLINHEVQFGIPLFAGGGKHSHIKKALYVYNYEIPGVMYKETFEKSRNFEESFLRLIEAELPRLNIPDRRKRRLFEIAELYCAAVLYSHARTTPAWGHYETACAELVCGVISKSVELAGAEPLITPEYLSAGSRGRHLLKAIEEFLFKEDLYERSKAFVSQDFGRVIGYGTKGKVASKRVPQLINTCLEPAVLWDKGAEPGDELCGMPIVMPELVTLLENDLLLVFPKNEEVIAEIKETLRQVVIKCRVYYYDDIRRVVAEMLPALYFPQFYENCELIYGEE